MKRSHQVAAAGWMLFALFIARESIRLEFYTAQGPGPGFFPLLLSCLLALLAIAMFRQAGSRAPDAVAPSTARTPEGRRRFALILVAIAAAATFLDTLGFRLTFFALYLVLMNLSAPRRWIPTTALAAAGSFLVYAVFVSVFDVPLPRGVFGF